MSNSGITLKGTMDPAAFAQLLEDLAKSVKAGTVCLQKGGEYVTLKPAGGLEFEVEAAVKKGKQKLAISVKWEEPVPAVTPGEIKITSVEPAPVMVEPAAAPEEAPQGAADAITVECQEKQEMKSKKK